MRKANLKPPVKKNDNIKITIDSYASDGSGIGRYEGYAVFVPYAIAGETVDVHIIKVNKGYAVGKINSIIEENRETRQEPICECYYKCGGCDMQHAQYKEQLKFKRERVFAALKRIGGFNITEDTVEQTLAADESLRYRNKASFPFGEVDGKVNLGFFAPRSHRLVGIDDCPIQKEDIVHAMKTVERWANKYKIAAFNEEENTGILRHLVVRTAASGVLVCIVTSGSALPYKNELVDMLKDSLQNLAGIVHNINNKVTNVILGSEYKTIYGSDTLCEEISGLKFNVRTPSFLQVNRKQTERLYETVLSYLNIGKSDIVYDIYSGIGTISLLLAQKAGKVIGIEYVREAVEDAQANAQLNGIINAAFIAGAAEEVMPQMVQQGSKAGAIVLDPPRKGCDEAVLQAIADSGAKQVVYVSCNPETLARDLRILADNGYELSKAQPIDMFPQTGHVECVTILTRIK